MRAQRIVVPPDWRAALKRAQAAREAAEAWWAEAVAPDEVEAAIWRVQAAVAWERVCRARVRSEGAAPP